MCQEISTNWGSQTWQDFDQLCEYNPVETELIDCLADVREPCQLGCKGLSYCTNFNNRSGALCSPPPILLFVMGSNLRCHYPAQSPASDAVRHIC